MKKYNTFIWGKLYVPQSILEEEYKEKNQFTLRKIWRKICKFYKKIN